MPTEIKDWHLTGARLLLRPTEELNSSGLVKVRSGDPDAPDPDALMTKECVVVACGPGAPPNYAPGVRVIVNPGWSTVQIGGEELLVVDGAVDGDDVLMFTKHGITAPDGNYMGVSKESR